METKDLVIIGGGAAGMSAALSAFNNGIKDILILEREDHLGGILHQCIHNGFGLTRYGEELTGPEYAYRNIKEIKEKNLQFKLNTQVLQISKDKIVTYSNSIDGVVDIKAKAIVVATGSYERPAGGIKLPGQRLNGVLTAGNAQKIINITGYMIGKRVIILGSGDIGLIMARRLTLEGAKVLCVAEIKPYSAGLNRNIQQCLIDFDIPLHLSTTVSDVKGKARVEKVILSKVDENQKIIPGTEQEFDCDCLILSVGLIPQTSLLEKLDVHFARNKGAIVNEYLESEIEGIFTCGNALHIHDLVDYVSKEGDIVGKAASEYIKNNLVHSETISLSNGNGITYVVPNYINKVSKDKIDIKFRVDKPYKEATLFIEDENNNVILKRKILSPVPSIMYEYKIDMNNVKNIHSLKVSLKDER